MVIRAKMAPMKSKSWCSHAGAKYDSSGLRRPGRPPKPQHIRDLMVRFAKENTGWGYTKLRDVMDLKTRHVEVAGIVCEAYAKWMLQVLRNLTDELDGFLLGKIRLIMDRDPIFTARFLAMLRRAGAKPVRLPHRSPNLNAFIERFIRSIKEECLDRVIPLGETHLRELIREYMAHYHAERPHQGLGGAFVRPADVHAADGPLVKRERLGGLLNYDYREAA
jgi:hypothetical protein